MQTFGFDDWEGWHAAGCTLLPFGLIVPKATLPDSWTKLFSVPASVLLESAPGGRFTYACDRPARIIVGDEHGALVRDGGGGEAVFRLSGNPLAVLEQLLEERRAPVLVGWPPMWGGLIGAFGYDLVWTWERRRRPARTDPELPLYAFIEPADLFVYDHQDGTLRVVTWTPVAADSGARVRREAFTQARERASEARSRWSGTSQSATIPNSFSVRRSGTPPPPTFGADEFTAAVHRVQEHIAAGDTYQVNLSHRESRATEATPVAIYESLRRINPSPYMGLLQMPDWSLVCGSPELLVRAVDGRLSSRPIAGTRRRAAAAPEDSALSRDLTASPKERAEHLMLVDLIRNDLGRVAAYGSVHVAEFMAVERYSHVMHLVSQVEARLADGRDWTEVVRAMFPGGTITGCPKIRTMELIDEIEPVGRGFYTGSLGWIGYAGDLEMNIIIRSMLVQDGVAHVQAGAGIVADSVANREWDEVLRKARALWVALDAATLLPR